jgi:hypothetical protein
MCDVKIGEGDIIPPKENVRPPKAKWHPLIMKECEMRRVLTPSHANPLQNQTIHQTLYKKMTSKVRG